MLTLLIHMLAYFGSGRNTSEEHRTSPLNPGGLCRQPTLGHEMVLMMGV